MGYFPCFIIFLAALAHDFVPRIVSRRPSLLAVPKDKCAACGYSLVGLAHPITCPECGAHHDPSEGVEPKARALGKFPSPTRAGARVAELPVYACLLVAIADTAVFHIGGPMLTLLLLPPYLLLITVGIRLLRFVGPGTLAMYVLTPLVANLAVTFAVIIETDLSSDAQAAIGLLFAPVGAIVVQAVFLFLALGIDCFRRSPPMLNCTP